MKKKIFANVNKNEENTVLQNVIDMLKSNDLSVLDKKIAKKEKEIELKAKKSETKKKFKNGVLFKNFFI
jgi:hypothetical protein